jgi:hypothetical protein
LDDERYARAVDNIYDLFGGFNKDVGLVRIKSATATIAACAALPKTRLKINTDGYVYFM